MTEYTQDQYLTEKETGTRQPNGALHLKKLKPWHKAALLMHLDGYSNNDIADVFSKRAATISIILNDPLARTIIGRAQQSHEMEFNALYGSVVKVLRRNLQGLDDHKALKAVQLYLKQREIDKSQDGGSETAEDVIQRVLSRVQIQTNVQVNTGGN